MSTDNASLKGMVLRTPLEVRALLERARESVSFEELPLDMLEKMETLIGFPLDRVRIFPCNIPHRLGAEAFTCGSDIFIESAVYDIGSSYGWFVLAHELTHVVQQRQGRLGSLRRDGFGKRKEGDEFIYYDYSLEEDADQVGSLARDLFNGKLPEQGPLYASSFVGEKFSAEAIQCVMTSAEFTGLTYLKIGKRDKIASIDRELARFHLLNSASSRDYVAILAQLRVLYAACSTYRQEKPGSQRMGGVDRLGRQIGFEEVILTALAKAQIAVDQIEKWDHIDEATRRYHKIKDNPEFARDDFWGELDRLIGQFSSMKPTPISTAIVAKDIEKLKEVRGQSGVPPILASCIDEATNQRIIGKLDFTTWLPGAKYNTVRDNSLKKYTLKHHLAQPNGVRFRLGSLLHELTHVVVSEAFDNTLLMLAISRSATEDQVLNEARTRNGKIARLKQTLEQMKDNEMASFLRKEMIDKTDYPVSGKFSTYIANFKSMLSKSDYEYLSNLCKKGVDCELIEYDTVINQMLMWCYLYDVPNANSAYTMLVTLAQENYVRRRTVQTSRDLKYQTNLRKFEQDTDIRREMLKKLYR